MLTPDIIAVFEWWFVLLLLGIGFLPVTFLLFEKFFDKGYIFSKVLGVAILSYVVFVVGVLHILPFTAVSSSIIFFLLVLFILVLHPQRWKILYLLKRYYLIFLLEELLFLLALFTWAYIHSFSPDIHGLEKYMDYGFVNSILRTKYFPPLDIWFPPLPINYYYFGHIMTGVLTKLSGLSSTVSFNLMLSTIFAFCFTQTFSIGANLYFFLKKNVRVSYAKVALAGFLTACLASLAGNLHILYAFFKPYSVDNPKPFWELPFSFFNPTYNPNIPNQSLFAFPNSYWYPNATRFIYHTIHEFPIYSWVVADLHGHVLDIPYVLLIIALLLSFFISRDPKEKNDDETDKKRVGYFSSEISPFALVFIGFLLSVMYMTNAWDGAIYLLLSALVVFAIYWQRLPLFKEIYERKDSVKIIKSTRSSSFFSGSFPKKWHMLFGANLFLPVLIITSSFVLFTLPYNHFFKPFVSGIGVLCAPQFLINIGKIGPFLFEADHCQHSYWWELVTLYGFFYFFVISFLIFVSRVKKLNRTDIFVLFLILLSTLLIILPEFVYVKDIYPAHYRANTMFKLVFQSFIMLSISSGYIIFRLLRDKEAGLRRRSFFNVFFYLLTLVLVTLVMMYPYFAVRSYYGDLKTYHGLNGTQYLQPLYTTDYEGIQWLNEHVSGQPIILEAQGDSYTDFARVSANTGLPTVLGWTVHEWLWRGSYDIPSPRIVEVKTMYETKDPIITRDLLKKYNVSYVFIGTLEYQKYPGLNEAKFKQIGTLVFQKGNTKIYQIN